MRDYTRVVRLCGMSVYSLDFRKKVVNALSDGETVAGAARRFRLDPGTVRNWRKRAAAGRLEPQRCGARSEPVKLTTQEVARLRQEVEARPGVTLGELARLVDHKVVQSTLSRLLTKLGYRYKKSHWSRASKSGLT